MASYRSTKPDGVHIKNLTQTARCLLEALFIYIVFEAGEHD